MDLQGSRVLGRNSSCCQPYLAMGDGQLGPCISRRKGGPSLPNRSLSSMGCRGLLCSWVVCGVWGWRGGAVGGVGGSPRQLNPWRRIQLGLLPLRRPCFASHSALGFSFPSDSVFVFAVVVVVVLLVDPLGTLGGPLGTPGEFLGISGDPSGTLRDPLGTLGDPLGTLGDPLGSLVDQVIPWGL